MCRPRNKETSAVVKYIVPWVIENGFIWGLAYIKWILEPVVPEGHYLTVLLCHIVFGLIVVEGSMACHWISANYIYSDIPFLSKTPQKHHKSFFGYLKMWLQCNFPVYFIGGLATLNRFSSMPYKEYESQFAKGWDFSFGFWLAKFFIVRFIVDIVFYTAHRMEHKYFYRVHKDHHRHTTCHVLATNLNFMWLDLFLEAFFPFFVAVTILTSLGVPLLKTERDLLAVHTIYYEVGSHVGKEIPTLSQLPIISFITRPLGLENHNVLFHDNHHSYNNCNYGITQWCDWLMGSRNVRYSER